MLKDGFSALATAQSGKCICGDRINLNNVPSKNKDTLIVRYVELRCEQVSDRLMSYHVSLPDLLELKLYEMVTTELT